MVVRKRKKHSRFRGYRAYHGSHKQWRGSGNRGGRGDAGLDNHKKGTMLKYDPEHFGKRGFKRHYSLTKDTKFLNLRELDIILDKIKGSDAVQEENGKIKVSLKKLGYDKLLGTGKITKPVIVEGAHFSKNAIKKIEEIGGKAVKV